MKYVLYVHMCIDTIKVHNHPMSLAKARQCWPYLVKQVIVACIETVWD